MSTKTPAVISASLTVLLLLLFAATSIITQMLVLNGVSERQGLTAMGISLACQGGGMILAAVFAWRLTNLAITKFNWNKILAVVIAAIAAILLGGAISFLSVIISMPVAGIR